MCTNPEGPESRQTLYATSRRQRQQWRAAAHSNSGQGPDHASCCSRTNGYDGLHTPHGIARSETGNRRARTSQAFRARQSAYSGPSGEPASSEFPTQESGSSVAETGMSLPDGHEEPISRKHDRESFDCGELALNEFLQYHARRSHDKGAARTFLAIFRLAGRSIDPRCGPAMSARSNRSWWRGNPDRSEVRPSCKIVCLVRNRSAAGLAMFAAPAARND